MPTAPATTEVPAEVLSPAARSQDAIREQIRAMRYQVKPEYIPPPRPQALIDATNAEMAEGARRIAMAEASRAQALPHKKSPSEGSTEPVYRPNDHIPSLSTDAAQHIPTKTYRVM
jgi:hypothetical protein